MKNLSQITVKQINEYREQISIYANSAQFKKAYNLALKLNKKYPNVLR